METIHLVKYVGPFGYIKPWSAVRDELTFSQLYLTTSTLKGMEIKLGVHKILRHKITYASLARMQEVTRPKQYNPLKPRHAVLTRGVMIEPELILAFNTPEEQELAFGQHICLCRNEDILLPVEKWEAIEEEFNTLPGFEFIPSSSTDIEALFHGLNRFDFLENGQHAPVYGRIEKTGEPMRVNANWLS